jgi:hypothetical protein
MNNTFSNGRHEYNGKFNSRGQRQRSKIVKALPMIASLKHLRMIEWQKFCKDYKPHYNIYSKYICDNCSNQKCKQISDIK